MRHLDLHRVPELWDDRWSLWKRSVFYPKNNHEGPREVKKCSLLSFGKSQWKASSPFLHWKSSEVDHLEASLLPTPTDISTIYKRGSSLINDIYLFVEGVVSWYTLSSKASKCAGMCSFHERGTLPRPLPFLTCEWNQEKEIFLTTMSSYHSRMLRFHYSSSTTLLHGVKSTRD